MRTIGLARAAVSSQNKGLVVHIGKHAVLIGRNQCDKTERERMSEDHGVKQQWRINR